MQHLKPLLLAVIAIFSFSFINAQSADDIINKYIDAIGGKDSLAKVSSLHMQTTVQVMGNDNPGETTVLNGRGYRSESEFNGQKFIQAYNSNGGWSINPMAGGSAEAMQDAQYKSGKDNVYVGGSLYNYAVNHAGKAELGGKEGNDYKIVYTSADSVVTTFYIDANSYLITKMIRSGEMQGQQVDITFMLSDYKKVDGGILLPFTLNLDFGGNFSMTSSVKTVDVNKPVDPGIFEMPK